MVKQKSCFELCYILEVRLLFMCNDLYVLQTQIVSFERLSWLPEVLSMLLAELDGRAERRQERSQN